jgi:Family of unknown function (DUF6069)
METIATNGTPHRFGLPTGRHLIVILSAVVVALATWALIQVLGVEPTVGKDIPRRVGPFEVALATLVAGVAAAAVHSWLARLGIAGLWPFVGSTALAVSIIGPSWFADGASAVALICLHIAVAFVLLVGFGQIDDGHGRRSRRRAVG